ncbi:MAG: Lrp/AsnC family transcriptional regulator [Rhizobiaceae bacterium]
MKLEKLDKRDINILKILSQDGRIKIADLARQLNLTATPCWERVKRLERLGIIKSYRAEIALQKVATQISVFVVLELENHRAETFQLFERSVVKYEQVIDCWAIGGGYDYLMQVVARDVEDYQNLMDRLLDQRMGIAHYVTYVVTKSIKSNPVPPFDMLLDDS